jgi:hypothetical protein
MDILLSQLIKKQNQHLIEAICEKYQLDKEEMLQKYQIPRYYVIGGDGRSYQLEWKETLKPNDTDSTS